MKKIAPKELVLKTLHSEVFKYLVAGVLTTIFYMAIRLVIYPLLGNATMASLIANLLAIIFAFFINDSYVFGQKRAGWSGRLVKFFLARLATLVLDIGLAYLLVDKHPELIGRFVNNNANLVNAIATLIGQVLIMVSNYVISKFFIFKNKK